MKRMLLLCSSCISIPAFGVDALPFQPADARSTGAVVSGQTSGKGDVVSGVTIHSARDIIPADEIGRETTASDGREVSNAYQSSAYLNYGLLRNLDLGLAVTGSSEDLGESSTIFGDEQTQSDQKWRFSSLKAMTKWQLIESGDFSLSFVPFIESGAGSSARQSVTRSESAKGGWLMAMSYGADGVGELAANGGYRYREQETIGDIRLRNELMGSAMLKAHLNTSMAVFGGAQGRRLMVSQDQVGEHGREWKARDSGEYKAGLSVEIGSLDLSFYGGKRVERGPGFGNGDQVAGMNLAMKLKGAKRRRTETDLVIRKSEQEIQNEIKKDLEEIEPESQKQSASAPAVQSATGAGDSAKAVDPQQNDAKKHQYGGLTPPSSIRENLGKPGQNETSDPDEFDAAAKSYIENARMGKSSDEIAEEELRSLKKADEVAKKTQEEQALRDTKLRNKERSELLKNEGKLRKEYRAKAKQEVQELEDAIPTEEMSLHGVDDDADLGNEPATGRFD